MAGVAALGAFEPFFDAIFVPVIRYLEALPELVAAQYPMEVDHPGMLPGRGNKGLGPGFADGVPAGADEFDAGFGALVGKVGVFRQKAVAGVQSIAAGGLGHGQKGVLVEVALRGLGRADAHRLVGQLDMKRLRVRLRVHGYRLDAHFPAGPQHPQGDLAPVGDQYPLQHGL